MDSPSEREDVSSNEDLSADGRDGDGSTGGALIANWEALDGEGAPTEAFRTGDVAEIRFDVDVLSDVSEVQAGLLIRTVEGVTAFGTSSLYHENNVRDARGGTTISVSFRIKLNLCPGTYFVTIAIAEAISRADMRYLDRKTDVIVLKIDQPRILCSGIASLPSTVSIGLANQ